MGILGTLLVVDGNGAITDFMAESLRDEGYMVTVAHDYAETLTSVDHQPSVLVLLNDMVVGLNTPLLRTHITHRHQVYVPIITTTTNPAVVATMTVRDRWANLAKAFSIDDLVVYVSHYVQPTPHAPVGPAMS